MTFGFIPFGWLLMLAFWGLVIWAIIALIRGDLMCGHNNHNAREKEKSPLEILKERYAKGEIGKKEFGEKKKDLK